MGGAWTLACVIILNVVSKTQAQIGDLPKCEEVEVQGASVDVQTDDFEIGEGGRSAGCHPWPSSRNDLYCTSILGSGTFYMPDPTAPPQSVDDIDLAATNARLGQLLPLLELGRSVVSATCFDTFLAYGCLLRFPPCEGGEPLKFNRDLCDFLRAPNPGCETIITFDTGLLTSCTHTITEPEPQYFFRPDEWIGMNAWEQTPGEGFTFEDVQDLIASLGSDGNLSCRAPLEPTLGRVAEGVLSCEFPCENPVFSSDEWLAIRLCFVIPGLLSLPFNIAVFVKAVSSAQLLQRASSSSRASLNWTFVLTVALAILFVFVGPLLSAIFGNEVGCASYTSLEVKESTICWISKTTPFVLQAFVNGVTATLFRVLVRTRAAKRLKMYKTGKWEGPVTNLMIWVVPTLLMSIAFALDDSVLGVQKEDGGSLFKIQYAYLVRNSITCFPRLPNVILETILIHLPLFLSGLLGLAFAIMVAATLAENSPRRFWGLICGRSYITTSEIMTAEHSSKNDVSQSDLSKDESMRGSFTEGSLTEPPRKSTLKRKKKKQTVRTQEELTSRIASQMIRFAGIEALFLVISFLSLLTLIPGLGNFTDAAFQFFDCASFGGLFQCFENSEELNIDGISCCTPAQCLNANFSSPDNVCADCSTIDASIFDEEGLPNPPTFALLYFSWSILPLLFGIAFASSMIGNCYNTVRNRVSGQTSKLSTRTGIAASSKGDGVVRGSSFVADSSLQEDLVVQVTPEAPSGAPPAPPAL